MELTPKWARIRLRPRFSSIFMPMMPSWIFTVESLGPSYCGIEDWPPLTEAFLDEAEEPEDEEPADDEGGP